MRATAEPGIDRGRPTEHHEWVKTRFVDPTNRAPGVLFLPARLVDNPHIDPDYTARLENLPPAEQQRLIYGDWEIGDDGKLVQQEWFTIIEPHHVPVKTVKVRYWDLAASEPTPGNPTPTTPSACASSSTRRTGIFYVTDLIRTRRTAGAVEKLVAETAARDGHAGGIYARWSDGVTQLTRSPSNPVRLTGPDRRPDDSQSRGPHRSRESSDTSTVPSGRRSMRSG
jgi:hypothetical protein